MGERPKLKDRCCPQCGGTAVQTGRGEWLRCSSCGQKFGDRTFYAHGKEAMQAQVQIVNYYHKMASIRTVASYAVSALFACVAAALIIFAPDSRAVAANVVAGAFLVLAAGIAGFTRLKASAPGIKIDTDRH